MFKVFESIGMVCFRNDRPIEYDAESLGKALASAHNYLHNTLLAGNFGQVEKRVEPPVSLGKAQVSELAPVGGVSRILCKRAERGQAPLR